MFCLEAWQAASSAYCIGGSSQSLARFVAREDFHPADADAGRDTLEIDAGHVCRMLQYLGNVIWPL